MSSEARGPTTTPPMTVPDVFAAMSLMKPSVTPCIFARGFVSSMSLCTRPRVSPSSICFCEKPTVAISGEVKMLDVTFRSLIGVTASPIAWYTAVRPCIDATEASGSESEQSPTA